MRRTLISLAPTAAPEAPLVCFIHVPKAAGTSVIHHLRKWSWRGLDHIEQTVGRGGPPPDALQKSRWISGHLALNKMQAALAGRIAARPLRLFGAIREPTAHVAAHCNWQIEIFHRGRRFYEAHPEPVQALSARIRAADMSDPQQVIDVLSHSPAFFANLQSRFLLGDDIDLQSAVAEARFGSYASLKTTDDLGRLVEDMTGHRPGTLRRSNASVLHFDRAVFRHPAVAEFLKDFNAADEALFARVSSRAGVGQGPVGSAGRR